MVFCKQCQQISTNRIELARHQPLPVGSTRTTMSQMILVVAANSVGVGFGCSGTMTPMLSRKCDHVVFAPAIVDSRHKQSLSLSRAVVDTSLRLFFALQSSLRCRAPLGRCQKLP